MTNSAATAVTGRLIEIDGIVHYRIEGVEQMAPFLMSVVSDSDLWMFASSTGNLTAGRRDADHAMLPYETEDRIHRSAGTSGPVTLVTRQTSAGTESWRPFGPVARPGATRAVSKSVLGNRLVFDETHHEWGVRFRAVWEPSARFGWVRTSELVDEAGRGHSLMVIDGLIDVMPAGVEAHTEQTTSNLVDAYKRSETGPWGRAAIFSLESLVTDRAEPAESLTATLVWSSGFPDAILDLDERSLDEAIRTGRVTAPPSELLTGRRGSYLLRGAIDLGPGEARSWMTIVDTDMDRVGIERRLGALAQDGVGRIVADVGSSSDRLRSAVELVDGFQESGDPVADAHHLSNTMFNIMRGGVFSHGYRIPLDDFRRHVRTWNAATYERHRVELERLPGGIDEAGLRKFADDGGDPDLIRLVQEYLPLSFSRRHGDPSRPWNRFSIRVSDEQGHDLLAYEGNWRDIFQNWEALLLSFPAYHIDIVAKFLNASTLDGHNPYRISDHGIDWEVPDPEDPWGNIGYWGDHQIVYLLRLLESWERVEPGAVMAWLQRRIFTYADIPYVLDDYSEMVEDPRNTITFDHDRERVVQSRVAAVGADGRLVHTDDGSLFLVTMLEKLLVPALAKITSFVPGGGIWMNTQRPEWNDANNALAGFGLSMVTLQYLYRYLGFLHETIGGLTGSVEMSQGVATWMADLSRVLDGQDPDEVTTPERRRRMMDDLGAAGTRYRSRVRGAVQDEFSTVGFDEITRFVGLARSHLAATIGSSRRADGLYHSYNLISFPSHEKAMVTHLDVMLEGQVAAISGGLLTPEEVADVVDRLFESDLYRADQGSFLLYPNVSLDSFLDRNRFDPAVLGEHSFLAGLVGDSATAVLRAGPDGTLAFNAAFTNAGALRSGLERADLTDDQVTELVDLYETGFEHHAFTGRSKAMYAYEGLGSIYWHMVGKLLVAVQECRRRAVAEDVSVETLDRLLVAYRRIRDGLGFRKGPHEYGAFPTDCYSHTPAHAGAQQPGMTGQVKEEIITRLGEIGLRFDRGHLALGQPLIPDDELFAGSRFRGTVCGAPVELIAGSDANVAIEWANGEVVSRRGSSLTAEESAEVFGRTGSIRAIRFTLPSGREVGR